MSGVISLQAAKAAWAQVKYYFGNPNAQGNVTNLVMLNSPADLNNFAKNLQVVAEYFYQTDCHCSLYNSILQPAWNVFLSEGIIFFEISEYTESTYTNQVNIELLDAQGFSLPAKLPLLDV
jgi:hypothetical protein